MLHTAQLCLPFHWIHREVALWVIWGSLCNDFVLFVFLVMFVLMLKASLMAHRCSFREDVREEGCPRCRPMGVSPKVRDEDSLCRLTLYKYKSSGKLLPWGFTGLLVVQAVLLVCHAFQSSS